MTYEEISEMLESIGLPYTYYQWAENSAPALPYIVFYYPGSNNFIADNKAYCKIAKLNVEFYSEEKDFDTEASIEAVFEQNDLVYTKTEQYIESDQMYEVLYQMEVNINES